MSDGRLLHGQQYFPDKDLVVQYTERMHDKDSADALLGATRTEITPNDRDSSVVKVYTDPTDIDSLVIKGIARVRLSELPPVLTGIQVVANQQTGTGDYAETFTGSSGGDHQDLSVNINGSSQNSASVMVDIIPTIVTYDNIAVWASRYFFYMTGTITTATIAARLTTIIGSTVNVLPIFKPLGLTFMCTGQSAAVRVEAKSAQSNYASATFQSDTTSTGRGHSTDGSVTIRAVEIPPTLHAAGSLTNWYREVKAAATATASTFINTVAQTVTVTRETPLQVAQITPVSYAATSPTSVPTTGLYLTDSDFSPDKEWGRTRIFAEVVDFSQYA